VFMEDEIRLGTVNPWNLQGRGAQTDVFKFLLAIVDTMRTWQDTKLGTLPGNSSRTVGIRLTEDEGGLNLNMPSSMIAKLIDLGDEAGKTLVAKFAAAPDTKKWKEHRWIRFRATFSAAARWLARLEEGDTPVATPPQQESYDDLIERMWPPATRRDALHATKSLVEERLSWSTGGYADPNFESQEPVPTADLRMRPTV